MICKHCDNKLIKKVTCNKLFYYCKACDAIYNDPDINRIKNDTSEDINSISKKLYKNRVDNFFKIFSMFKRSLKISKNDYVLDIGTFDGSFLYALKKNDYLNVFGLDNQLNAIEYAKNKGLNVFYGDFPYKLPTEISSQKFKLITSFENIYYLNNLELVYKKIRDLLEFNGYFVIKLHQHSSLYYKKQPYDIRTGSFECMQNINTIKYFAKRYDFKIRRIYRFDKSYFLHFLGYSSYKTRPQKAPSKFERLINRLISYIPMPYKYADKIIVVLEKK